jgi:hypothetical protein
MPAPAYVTAVVVAGDIAIIAAIVRGVSLSLARANWERSERRAVVATTIALLVGWFAVTGVLSFLGAYGGPHNRVPTIEFGIMAPLTIGFILLWRSQTLRRVLDATPQEWIVGVQVYRVLGVTFLTLLSAGLLPPQFALPAGWGDITTGVLSLVIAIAFAKRAKGAPILVGLWNVFGLLDLAVALTMGFLTSPSPVQMFSLGAPNELISVFPLVLVPVFAVPVAILLHVASLMKLARARKQHVG